MLTDKEYKELSIKEFTKAAANYESDHAGIYNLCKDDYPFILEEIKKEDFETLLDAGCGTAPMLSLLTEEYHDKKFTGLDLTPEMIEVARKKNLPNTTLVVGDCENLPFEENSFDVIINSQSFHHYPNPQDFFNSVYKVLKPGGRLILRDMSTSSKFVAFLANHIEMPLAHAIGKGDVGVRRPDEIRTYCENASLKVEKLEMQKKMRIHLVARKMSNYSC